MIILENRETALRYYEIPTEIGGGEEHTLGALQRSAAGGVAAVRVHPRTYPTTLTLAARGTKGSVSDPLPDRFADVPKIAQAIATGRIVKRDVPDPKPAPEAPSPPAEAGTVREE